MYAPRCRTIASCVFIIHQNPVEAGLVLHTEDYRYSSAIDYSDEKGILDHIVVFRMFDL